jgi:hypothetical protein
MDSVGGLHGCNICNKVYSSYKSLWNHNKKFHNFVANIMQTNENIMQTKCKHKNDINNSIICKFCKKMFSHRNSRWKHEKTCKNKEQLITINKNEFDNIKKELEDKINKLELNINKPNKITNNNNNTTNNNNGTIINNKFVLFPCFGYDDILSKKEIISILNKQYEALEESVMKINFNENHPEHQNIYITNLKDDNAHIFNGKQFVAVDKNDAISQLIYSHYMELERAFKKYGCKLNSFSQNLFKDFLQLLFDERKEYKDDNNNKYKNYHEYKKRLLIKLIYNNTDKTKLSKLKSQKLEELLSEESSDTK